MFIVCQRADKDSMNNIFNQVYRKQTTKADSVTGIGNYPWLQWSFVDTEMRESIKLVTL